MKAECSWGYGPDILISLNGIPLVLHDHPNEMNRFKHGVVKEGSIDLTVKQAKKLLKELYDAINAVEHLECVAGQHDKHYQEG
ncbi:MAG: hypothetical protein R6V72_11040 [Cyclobacterium sp.]|uniref:hypothetical protein n=1 Tax=Cyclobacterium sp. TaxID=1966343 RepID=UPI00397049E3